MESKQNLVEFPLGRLRIIDIRNQVRPKLLTSETWQTKHNDFDRHMTFRWNLYFWEQLAKKPEDFLSK